MSGTDGNSELTTSQINQSEAGPDIVDPGLVLATQDPAPGSPRDSTPRKPDAKAVTNSNHEGSGGGKSGPNPALQALDRLISLSPSPVKDKVQAVQVQDRPVAPNAFNMAGLEQSVLEVELAKLHELLVKQEAANQEKMDEYESRLTKLTGQSCLLQGQLRDAEDREKALVKKVNEQNQNQVQLSIVMQEYEKLISKLTAEIETEKTVNRDKMESLTAEKDSALVHLANVEAAFTDVHQKYEKCKKVIEDYKKNEAKMKSLIADQVESLKIKEKQLETVQVHASKELESVHGEIQRSRAAHEQDMTRLRALLRKTELKVISLQESLEQKIKENQELTTICDDLIEGKVPAH